MKTVYEEAAWEIAPDGIALKVFRTGKSMHLPNKACVQQDPKAVAGVHSHFTYEIFFVTEGALELITEESRTVYERAAVIIPPRIKHYTVPRGDGCYCLLFSVTGAEHPFPHGVCAFPLSADADFYISRLAQKAEQSDRRAAEEARLLVALLFSEILCGRLSRGQGAAEAPKHTKHINAIEQYVNGHIYQKITASTVAAAVFLSPRQVARVVSATYGCSLSQLVNGKKLDAAQMLLQNTDLTVAEIATKIYLGAENYFYHLFKQRFGISPLQYRKKSRAHD
jgi:AraC-like DNA-binding protein